MLRAASARLESSADRRAGRVTGPGQGRVGAVAGTTARATGRRPSGPRAPRWPSRLGVSPWALSSKARRQGACRTSKPAGSPADQAVDGEDLEVLFGKLDDQRQDGVVAAALGPPARGTPG